MKIPEELSCVLLNTRLKKEPMTAPPVLKEMVNKIESYVQGFLFDDFSPIPSSELPK